MSTSTVTRTPDTTPHITHPISPPRPLALIVADASDVMMNVPLDDARWITVGPLLSELVDAVRRAAGGTASPIGADPVPPVLRLRELAWLAQVTAGATGPRAHRATPEVEAGLRSLRAAALGGG